MKLTYLSSASVLISHENTNILCDPWLVDGEFYGSWFHYPSLNFKPEDFNFVDYIYISHIHPDHLSIKTLSRMDKKIPVIILNYVDKFLKRNIERLGFNVIELEHNKRTHLKDNLHINILAAHYCNPELCSKLMGCSNVEKIFGATSLDSMSVIDNGKEVIVNTNDCPFEIAKFSADAIKEYYKNIDFLLVGYSGAGPYPQCFDMLTDQEKNDAAIKKKKQFFNQAESYVNLFQPKFFMPFAGRYTLGGKLADLNDQRGVPELEEAFDYFTVSSNINQKKHKCIILNAQNNFDISTEKASAPYRKSNLREKINYIKNVLLTIKFDFENKPHATLEQINRLLPKCYERFENRRKKINYNSDKVILLKIIEDKILVISCNGSGYKIIPETEKKDFKNFVLVELDDRLLNLLLLGPKFAHWNNAEIGSHLRFYRYPDVFERAQYHCLCYFHS